MSTYFVYLNLRKYLEAFVIILKNGGFMVLNFNLRALFLFCIGLMFWRALLPYTWLVATVFLGIYLFFLYKKQRVSFADGIFTVAFLLDLWYLLGSWGPVRQYDYFNFYVHADHFIQNHFFLERPIYYLKSVFFQPPLWGVMVGIITQIMIWLGYTVGEDAFAFVRFLNLFAVSGVYIVFCRLLNLFEFKPMLKKCLYGLFCFFPIHGIMANLANNDAPVYLLMLEMFYEAVIWYRTQSWKSVFIISAALFIGGMIKFSALMPVPALGVLGLCMLFNEKNKLSRRLWGQFSVIVLGAVLGFSWGIFLLYFHFPLVPPPVDVTYQSMQMYSISERLFSLKSIMVPMVDMHTQVFEPNVWLTLVKTALFGEWWWKGTFFAYVLYVEGLIFAILCLWGFIGLLKYKIGQDFSLNLFLIVLIFSVICAWANFWLDYPYFCSTEFRYTVILLPVAIFSLGHLLMHKSLSKAINYTLAGGIVIMLWCRIMLYLYTI